MSIMGDGPEFRYLSVHPAQGRRAMGPNQGRTTTQPSIAVEVY